MTYDVILRKKQNKYIARVRDWPEVVIEEETREAALTQIKQHLTTYLSQPPEVIQIELEPVVTAEHPWLQFAGMWADDPMWDDFVTEVAAYRQEMDKADAEA
jgi:predicted RNase H-like HicB family nuclease